MKKPHGILHVSRSADGGVAVVVDRLVRGMDCNRYIPVVLFESNAPSKIRDDLIGSHISVIGPSSLQQTERKGRGDGSEGNTLSEIIERKFGRRSVNAYFVMKSFWDFVRADLPKVKRFIHHIKKNGIELVHTHSDLHSCKAELIAAWFTKIPVICHNHSYAVLNHVDMSFSRFVDKFVYISVDMCRYHEELGKPRHKSVVIHNGLDPAKFSLEIDSHPIRQEFGAGKNDILVGLIGRIDWWKGHEYFLAAIAKAAIRCPKIRGVIIGGVEENVGAERNRKYYQSLQCLTAGLGVNHRVTFAGHRNDIPEVMGCLDLIVHASSLPEPFGLVVIEAMAAGKPIIATRAGGILDIVEHGVNGLLVPPKDSDAIADAIISLSLNRAKASMLSEEGKLHVRRNFTIERQIGAIQGLYDSLIKGAASQSKDVDRDEC